MGNKNKPCNQNESINPYEKERMKVLEANAAKMKAKGFNRSLVNKTLQEKYDRVSKNIVAELSKPKESADCQIEQQKHPDKRCPSQADLYMESRKRNVGRTYLTQDDETRQNIEKMKALQSLDDGSTKSDPYYDVMGKKEHSGRLRMYGLGVTKSSLKNKDPKNPFILPPIFLETISQQLEKKLEEVDKRQEARFEQKLTAMLSKIREANPGVDLVIPDIPTDEGDASSSHQN